MGREQTRSTLLETGQRIFLERGYNSTGIEAVLQAVGVPKGSFYYYFDNKEDFGLQVLDRFRDEQQVLIDQFLGDESLSPRERMRRYFESKIQCLESVECRKGCLLGNLSLEMADQSEAFRTRLGEMFCASVRRFSTCIRQAQDAGEVSSRLDADDLAAFLFSSWQGAVLRAKTSRCNTPLRAFLNIMFSAVLC